MTERSLYECFHARVISDQLRCRLGHRLLPQSVDGGLALRRLAKGEPLVFGICQKCTDFDRQGPPVPEEERGWLDYSEKMLGGRSKKCRKTPSTGPHSGSMRHSEKKRRTG